LPARRPGPPPPEKPRKAKVGLGFHWLSRKTSLAFLGFSAAKKPRKANKSQGKPTFLATAQQAGRAGAPACDADVGRCPKNVPNAYGCRHL
jgi:hypothetical protein